MFKDELKTLLNRFSCGNKVDAPDFILCNFLLRCLDALDEAMEESARIDSGNDCAKCELFVTHIKKHIGQDQKVTCKTCNKTIDEICGEGGK
jgi:hypothetical protein